MAQPTQNKRRLRVLFTNGVLNITGKSGTVYKYDPATNLGYLDVLESDVQDFLKMKFSSGEREEHKTPYFSL